VKIQVLGPLAGEAEGRPLDLGPPKQRTVLGLLVAAEGRPVSVEHLVDQVWGNEPPSKPVLSLHAYVANLRRVLEPGQASRTRSAVLRSLRPGYALAMQQVSTDTWHFGRLLADAGQLRATEPARARDCLESALGLWRGDAYGGVVDCPVLRAEAARLGELRLAAEEDRWEVEIDLGGHAAAVAGLERLVAGHPWRERLWCLLAVALYRSQRQGDALNVFQRARKCLVEDLGVGPGPEMSKLETAVLAQDPALDGPVPHAASPGPLPTTSVTASRQRSRPGKLFGYTAELARLSGGLAEAVEGRGRVALVSGEPGIGKTKLAQALVAEATSRGVRAGWGGWDVDGGLFPLQAWSTAVRGLVGAGGREDLAALVGEAAAADLAPLGFGPHPHKTASVDAESAGSRLASAVLALLSRLGREAPALLVLDDVHWADPDSLRVLRVVSPHLGSVPALVVVTKRDTWGADTPGLAATLSSLARQDPVRVRLRGLAPGDVAPYVQDKHGLELSPAAAQAIWERTDGNPFFINQLAGLLADQGELADLERLARRAIPQGARDVVRGRLLQLPDGAARALAAASVVGTSFDLDIVRWVAGGDGGGADDALYAAMVLDIVAEDADVPNRFRFAHSLVQEVVYADLGSPRRAALHGRVAAAIEALRAGQLDSHLAALASHYRQAGPQHAGEAWRAALHAGDQAEQQSAGDQAVRCYAEALGSIMVDPAATPPERYLVLRRLGAARTRSGQMDAAWDSLKGAARLALGYGDPAAAAAAVLDITQDVMWPWRLRPTVDDEAVALFEELLGAVPADRADLRSQLTAALAVELFYDEKSVWRGGWGGRSVQLADEAVAMDSGGPAARLHVLEVSWTPSLRPGGLDHSTGLVEERVRLAEQLADPLALARALTARSAVRMEQGSFAAGWADLDRAAALARAQHSVPVTLVIDWALALRPFMTGDFAAAEGEITRLRDIHEQVPISGAGLWVMQLAQLRYLQGRLGELVSPLDQWLAKWPALRDLRALAELEAHGPDRARAMLGPWAGQPPLVHDYTWLTSTVVRARVWLGLGDPQALRDLRADLEPHAGRFVYEGTGLMFHGLAGHTVGELALAAGDAEAAVEHLGVALRRHRDGGCAPYAALSEWALATALHTRGASADRRQASRLRSHARSEAQRIGLRLAG
jgi:DNA-binding SARP family transcriptional activator/tetratricopeptide (TPR) repeat protein